MNADRLCVLTSGSGQAARFPQVLAILAISDVADDGKANPGLDAIGRGDSTRVSESRSTGQTLPSGESGDVGTTKTDQVERQRAREIYRGIASRSAARVGGFQ